MHFHEIHNDHIMDISPRTRTGPTEELKEKWMESDAKRVEMKWLVVFIKALSTLHNDNQCKL